MSRALKTKQLQIRLSRAEKAALQQAASRAGLDVSAYVLAKLASPVRQTFARAIMAVEAGEGRFALAELNDLLTRLTGAELSEAIADGISPHLSAELANTVAAMVETACARRQVAVPAWTLQIAPLAEPVFGSSLQSLRLYLLTHSPGPFRRRNLFIDATLDARV
jgi:hypothetical protein